MNLASNIATAFSMNEEAWRRHANPWSVWTRFAAIPLMILAVWSRVWIGWWALLPVALVVVWLFLNPIAFFPIATPRNWVAKGIFGERLWLKHRGDVPEPVRVVLRWLIAAGLAGFAILAYGLWRLDAWPTIFGASLIVMAQLWRIDRFSLLYEEMQRDDSAA
jgi:hypothetical protein